jgi:hypothetical protein
MFDNDKLYNLLASGHSAEDIVALFTSSMNEAEARLKKEEEERKAREAETAKRKELEATKRADFMEAVEGLLTAIGKHYPDLAIEPTDEVCGPIADLIIMSIDLEGLRDKRHISLDVKPIKVKMADTDKDVFAKFFKQFGLS